MGQHFLNALKGQGNLTAEQQALIDSFGLGEEEPEAETSDVPPTISEAFAEGQFDWMKIIRSHVFDSLRAWEGATGQLDGMADNVFFQYQAPMWNALHSQFLSPSARTTHFLGVNDVSELQQTQIQDRRTQYYRSTQEGITEMIQFGIQFMGGQMGAPLSFVAPSGSGGRRGAGGPSAQDIRNQFDIEELSTAVDDMSRMLVFEPHRGAKQLARQYVDLMVKDLGKKNIDFETFVRADIAKTARFKSIYRNKPEALKAEQYMAPFFQQARSVVTGDEASDIAIGGAQFGADPQAFASRLARTDAVTGSAPFINSLQGKLQGLNQIFAGS